MDSTIAGEAAHPHLAVGHREGLDQQCVRSLATFDAGDVVATFSASAAYGRPSRMTVQVSEREHIELAPALLRFLNHACDPNLFFDVDAWELVALRPIAPGDELTFFYPSTEWRMASPFDCRCGSPKCLGRVDGASALPAGALAAHRLTPHVARRLATQSSE